eukprot:gnl/Hemi2/3973_TR1392_c0_g1_i1.p2 gnl/Hemi2/3973_TR1392_c0_g1~~gnl/Hemi2/3973_TR1392_c0_g1_i1.p2  ORF type:complete len:180 (+),score=38.24 gnl/Hemi2/3973_TR1392_c0_g1_i1:74-613(+)
MAAVRSTGLAVHHPAPTAGPVSARAPATHRGGGQGKSLILPAASEVPEGPLTGTGVFVFPNNATYDGEWVKTPGMEPIQKRHGKGTYKDGELYYTGDWKDDAMHGTGSLKTLCGALYEGGFVENKFHGVGKYTWPDGSSFTGDWVDNKMQGKGTYISKDGGVWKGEFVGGNGPCLLRQL